MIYALTIGLGAFLLFQVQPIAAKTILPWFGGSAAVWTTCLLFFQAALLLGYVYAHWSDRRLRPSTQAWLHIALLTLSLGLLPLAAGIDWKRHTSGDPSLRILLLLSATIGLPYTLLATTGPLVQAWWRRSGNRIGLYRLYALSNAGSLLGLLSYPILVEPYLSRRHQIFLWAGSFTAYAILMGTMAMMRRGDADLHQSLSFPADVDDPRTGSIAPPSLARYGLWIALSACASTLLAATTSFLSQNVAPVPFLWVVPLSLYLLTFIICFSHDRAYWRSVWLPLAAVAIGGMAYLLVGYSQTPHLYITLPAFLVGLFCCCMFCHGELARAKPAPEYLTTFYVAIAIGGALGSLFAGLIAPHVFVVNAELPVGLVLTASLALAIIYREYYRTLQSRVRRLVLFPTTTGLLVFLMVYVAKGVHNQTSESRIAVRNFYGSLRVIDAEGDFGEKHRELLNGVINHGAEFVDQSRWCDTTTYYGPTSGVGTTFFSQQRPSPMRVGILGLGTGTIAGYGHPGDVFKFYEINPLVTKLARQEFHFLTDCPGRVEVIPGDARLSLEREPDQQFDLLAVDAFSGDSIPVHLLTKEAFSLFFRHLKPDGILAIHISNRYVNLRPIVSGMAKHFRKDLLVVTSESDTYLQYNSIWALIAEPGGRLQEPAIAADAEPLNEPLDENTLWTDDYSSLWKLLRW